MQIPEFTMRELFDASVHMGHKVKSWNPLMSHYIYGTYNTIHVLDLQKTVPLLHNALKIVHEAMRNRGRLLFVGTKIAATDTITETANRCGQYYVISRWVGGLLTNWHFISQAVKKLKKDERNSS